MGRKKLLKVQISDLPVGEFFIRGEDLPTLESAETYEVKSGRIAFIAPLDNLIWNRKMIQLVFDFLYFLEESVVWESSVFVYNLLCPVYSGEVCLYFLCLFL